jgi:hypothetical protein
LKSTFFPIEHYHEQKFKRSFTVSGLLVPQKINMQNHPVNHVRPRVLPLKPAWLPAVCLQTAVDVGAWQMQ